MKKFLIISIVYVFIAILFWFIFSIGNANFIVFEWSFEARSGYCVILSMLLIIVAIGYPIIEID